MFDLEQRAIEYAEQQEVIYLMNLDSTEQQDPAEQQAAKEVYEEAYLEYLRMYSQLDEEV